MFNTDKKAMLLMYIVFIFTTLIVGSILLLYPFGTSSENDKKCYKKLPLAITQGEY